MEEPWSPAWLPPGRGRVHLEQQDGLAILRLDNPGARNALSPGMMAELGRHLESLGRHPPRALILTGEGGFCAGGDLASVRSDLLAPGAAAGMQSWMARQLDAIERLPAPVLAAVEGPCLGGGAELLMACDLVVVAPDARIGFLQARMGVSPGWGGGARLVARLGRGPALRLLLEARPLPAAEALRLGLAHRLAEPGGALELARSWAAELSAHPPEVVAAAVALARGGDPREERAWFLRLWGGAAHQEALARSPAGRGGAPGR